MHVSQHQPSVAGHAEQSERMANRALYVPVRRGPAGDVVRLWRTPFGTRTAVAFTTDRRLRSVLGPTQPWIRLSEAALLRLAEPMGAKHLTVDPVLTARPPASWGAPETPEAPDVPVTPEAPAPAESHGTRPVRAAGSAAP
ncbi:hypothetical protein SAMN05216223_103292 [Actinacidiphila yanglinensis]|uniref:SseB protein N-terminal domain-containing protein n=1 Tax=Actinacidiphila yanglinensis TaxID=310779 RepID=A0A1H5XJD3_9ACTN|nr:SAV_915 family protein [Actinacidiphila yanglinensis]SEG11871.1 hypothetical protein SAMN05216223_103292 [Actinacidiphila yanglinensis]